jgi:prophage regulatory protein
MTSNDNSPKSGDVLILHVRACQNGFDNDDLTWVALKNGSSFPIHRSEIIGIHSRLNVGTAPSARSRTRFLSYEELQRLGIPFSESRLYGLIKDGLFPRPVKVGQKRAWVEIEVHAWIAARIAERDAASNP